MIRLIIETFGCFASALAEMVGQVVDCHLALARHWTARFRRRFIDADVGVLSLYEELDYAQWCRDLKKPIEDPVMRRLLEEDVDWLFDVKCYRC